MKELLGCWGVELFYESGKGDCLKCSSNKKGMCRLEVLKRLTNNKECVISGYSRIRVSEVWA